MTHLEDTILCASMLSYTECAVSIVKLTQTQSDCDALMRVATLQTRYGMRHMPDQQSQPKIRNSHPPAVTVDSTV